MKKKVNYCQEKQKIIAKKHNDFLPKVKFITSIILALLWVAVSVLIAKEWISEVRETTSYFFTIFALSGIAFIPGFMILFMYSSMLFDKREKVDLSKILNTSILIAAFNEEENISKPLFAIENQEFNGLIEVIVIDDGSSDNTSKIVRDFISKPRKHSYRLITLEENSGKSAALNAGLKESFYETIVSMDADTTLGTNNSIQYLVSNLSDKYQSVAGTVISRNPNKNWVTKIQEWDYLFGISIVKRIQSMYSGTLVCQGAFSAYKKSLLKEVGGWKNVVGEDIVLSWDILKGGHKTYHCTRAIALTETPDNYKQFFHQRKRWSRGMIEAFRSNWKLLFKARLSTIFIWYNLFFPYIDFVFAFIFFPSVIASIFFDYHLLAGIKTLWIIPLSFTFTTILYFVQKRTFKDVGLMISKNIFGMMFYVICFQIIQTPATISGYVSELLKLKKNWGTKKSKNLALITLLLLSSSLAFSQKNNIELGSKVFNDSDKNLVFKSWTEYRRGTDSLSMGIEIGNVLISDHKSSNHYYAGLNLHSRFNENISLDLSTEQYLSKWKPFLYNGIVKISPFKRIYTEIFFSRNLIETTKSLEKKYTVYSNGLTLDYYIIKDRLILIGGYINQQFGDNNSRHVYIGRLAWIVNDWFVLNSTNKLMRAKNSSTYYFCPNRFDTYTINAYKNIAVLNDNILLKPELGVGMQYINDFSKDFYYGKLLIKGDISEKLSLNLSTMYSTAISEYGSYGLIFANLKLNYNF